MPHARVSLILISLCTMISTVLRAEVSKPWPVAVILPFSGPTAEYGIAFKNGIELASRDDSVSAQNIRYVFEDSKYDSRAAVSSFKKVSLVDNAKLVYVFGGPMSDVLAPLADRAAIPLLVSINDPRTAIGRRYVIRFSNPAAQYGKLLAEWLAARGAHRIGIVHAENQYLSCMLEGFRQSAKSDQKLEILDLFQPEDTDFRSTISKLKHKNYDALGIYLLPGQTNVFFKLLRQFEVNMPTFGTDFFESASEIMEAQGAMEGTVFPNNVVSERFHQRYLKEFANDSQITWAGYGYEFASLVMKTYSTLKGQNGADEITAALRATAKARGVMGDSSFVSSADGDSYFAFHVVLKQIKDGEVVEMK